MSDSLISRYESLVAVDLCIRTRKYQHPHGGGGGNMITDGGTGALIEDSTATPGCVRSSDILNTARILSSCNHLRVFRLSSVNVTIDVNTALQLFISPWACLGLEILWLSQISVPAAIAKQGRISTLSSSTVFGQHGWSVQSSKGLHVGQPTILAKSMDPLDDQTLLFYAQTAVSSSAKSAVAPANLATFSGATPAEIEDPWAFGTEFPKKLFPQIGVLSLLKELCLNKVQYSRTAYT
ncbi:hypothetical protein BGZ82_000957 [Podila clonocystis]|nr:hypothetical protein BGZ82_000957 [Podila clonocystis]